MLILAACTIFNCWVENAIFNDKLEVYEESDGKYAVCAQDLQDAEIKYFRRFGCDLLYVCDEERDSDPSFVLYNCLAHGACEDPLDYTDAMTLGSAYESEVLMDWWHMMAAQDAAEWNWLQSISWTDPQTWYMGQIDSEFRQFAYEGFPFIIELECHGNREPSWPDCSLDDAVEFTAEVYADGASSMEETTNHSCDCATGVRLPMNRDATRRN